jgi:hypothetical protein
MPLIKLVYASAATKPFPQSFGGANLIAFSSGYGDGMYATYAGFDADGQVSVAVTDFNVIPVTQ